MTAPGLLGTEPVAAGEESRPTVRKRKRADKQHFAVRLPTVNLLSPSVLEDLAVARLRRRFALAALALVVLLAGGWWGQGVRIAEAEAELAAQQTQAATLTARVNTLVPVRLFYAAVAQRKQTAAQAMASEVLFSRVFAELAARTPDGVQVETVSVDIRPPTATGASAPAAPAQTGAGCPTPDPFTATSTVGCITIGGSATSREAVGSLIVRLSASDLFVGPFISASNASGEGKVAFTGTVGVPAKVFSGRYADLDRLTTTRGAK